jgi:hypothetical protein
MQYVNYLEAVNGIEEQEQCEAHDVSADVRDAGIGTCGNDILTALDCMHIGQPGGISRGCGLWVYHMSATVPALMA